jgi:hypothetical protein
LENLNSTKGLEHELHDNPNIKRFINELLEKCNQNQIELDFSYTEKVDSGDGMECNGYFDNQKKVLVIATKNPFNLWLGVLVHESCHLDQYIDDNAWFKKCNEDTQKFNDWLSNPKNDLENTKDILSGTVGLELDCEKRSLQKIKEYNLPIDIEMYTKEANEYLFSYIKSLKTKKWDDGSEPIDKRVRESMPDHLLELEDYLKPHTNSYER